MKSNVEFVGCDFPEANEFTLHIFSAVAQHERKMISEGHEQPFRQLRPEA